MTTACAASRPLSRPSAHKGDPKAAAEFAGKLAAEIRKSHAPNIVYCPTWAIGAPPADPAYVIRTPEESDKE